MSPFPQSGQTTNLRAMIPLPRAQSQWCPSQASANAPPPVTLARPRLDSSRRYAQVGWVGVVEARRVRPAWRPVLPLSLGAVPL